MRACKLPGSSSTATTPRWTSTAARSSRPATTPPAPSGATAPSTRTTARPKTLTPAERAAIVALGDDLGQVWDAPTTTDKDRKQLLRTLLEEVNMTASREEPRPVRPPDPSVERRRDHRADHPAATPAAENPHRRGHHRPDPPPGRALPRRGHRRDPQPAAPHHRPRNVIHRQ